MSGHHRDGGSVQDTAQSLSPAPAPVDEGRANYITLHSLFLGYSLTSLMLLMIKESLINLSVCYVKMVNSVNTDNN
jgi:hypothetical protein